MVKYTLFKCNVGMVGSDRAQTGTPALLAWLTLMVLLYPTQYYQCLWTTELNGSQSLG
jgi:hypothetical protein